MASYACIIYSMESFAMIVIIIKFYVVIYSLVKLVGVCKHSNKPVALGGLIGELDPKLFMPSFEIGELNRKGG